MAIRAKTGRTTAHGVCLLLTQGTESMTKRISIGTWAYSIGPYANSPIPFTDVVAKLNEYGFDGLELGGFGIHPNPDLQKTPDERAHVRELWESRGMACSGLAADLWSEKL